VGVVLPNELVWVLGAIGVTWPNIDEDEIRRAGDEFRKLSVELSGHKSGAMSEIEQMLHLNSSESLKVFEALWTKVVKGHPYANATEHWARAWQEANGPLGADERLAPVKPFLDGGDEDLANFTVLDGREALRSRGAAAQRRRAQDG